MDEYSLERNLAQFQARARGYLARKEVCRAREDFEEIVAEIDGGLNHLRWSQTVLPFPNFMDTKILFLQHRSSTWKPANPEAGVGLSVLRSAASSGERGGTSFVLSDRMEAERDDSQSQRQATGVERAGESSSIWRLSDLHLDHERPCKGLQQHRLAQDVPRTPEALRRHRNTLTMELLWLQQAIDSRKKYLSLKDRLSVS